MGLGGTERWEGPNSGEFGYGVAAFARTRMGLGVNGALGRTKLWRVWLRQSDQLEALAQQPLGGEQGEQGAEPPPTGPDEGLANGGLFAICLLE